MNGADVLKRVLQFDNILYRCGRRALCLIALPSLFSKRPMIKTLVASHHPVACYVLHQVFCMLMGNHAVEVSLLGFCALLAPPRSCLFKLWGIFLLSYALHSSKTFPPSRRSTNIFPTAFAPHSRHFASILRNCSLSKESLTLDLRNV